MKASWREEQQIVLSELELRRVIWHVGALGVPTMLFLEAETGETLVVGLGHDETVLTFVAAGGIPSFHSVGDTARGGRLRFWCRDQVDEFMEEMALPASVAISAALEFFAKRVRPSCVRWEADW